MTLDEIKAFCADKDEQKSVNYQYNVGIKEDFENFFTVWFLAKNNNLYVQKFSKSGMPVGRLIPWDKSTSSHID